MIVITTLDTETYYIAAGSKFQLTISGTTSLYGAMGIVVIEEECTKCGFVDFCASFRFTLDDGTCVGNHFCGIFARESELPEEIKNAKMIKDLSPKQRENFFKSINIKI